jgi:hypothetical protein
MKKEVMSGSSATSGHVMTDLRIIVKKAAAVFGCFSITVMLYSLWKL